MLGRRRRRVGSRQSLPRLARSIADDTVRLLRVEVQSVRARFSGALRLAALAAGLLAGAATLAFLAFIGLVVAIGLALALVLPEWAAAFIVAVALALVSSALALLGRAGLQRAREGRVSGPVELDTALQDTRYRLDAELEALSTRLGPRRFGRLNVRNGRGEIGG